MFKKICSSDHEKKIPSKYYCSNCKIYMCEVCEKYHSKKFCNHNIYNSDENISEIFDGFCKENNHLEILEFFCKTHNKLCCSSCITKIKKKGKGQHTDCDICLIEDIKDTKKDLLNKNYTVLEELSKNIGNSINELKDILETINTNKYNLKLKIQKTFTEIKNKINEKENELMIEVDKMYESIFISHNKLKQIYEIPSIAKESLEKVRLNDYDYDYEYEWEKYNKLSFLINNSINIENNILNINQNNKIISKFKNDIYSVINLYMEKDNYINNFLNNFISFGKENKIIISNNINEEKIDTNLNIKISSLNFIKNNNEFSLELLGFNSKNFLNYYSEEIKYEDDEYILTLCLEGNDENSVNSIIQIINEFILEKSFSMRKCGNKLFLDYRLKNELEFDFFEAIKDMFNESKQKLLTFKSSIKLSELLKMNANEFFNSLLSLFISININKTTLNKLKSYIEKKLNKEKKDMKKKKKKKKKLKIKKIKDFLESFFHH